MGKRKCCCIPDQNKLDQPCGKDAEWEIWSGDTPDDFTDACTEHVGDMLTDAPKHTIYQINE